MEIPLSNEDYEVKDSQKNFFTKKFVFWDKVQFFSGAYGGFATILTLCLFTYFFLDLFLKESSFNSVLQWGANIIPLKHIQPYRFITSAFLHGGFFHLLGNMVSLYYLSTELVKKWDSRKIFLIFLISASLANASTFVIRSAFQSTPETSIGASGGVFGLMGAFIAFIIFSKTLPPAVKALYKKSLMPFIFLNLFIGLLPSIDFLSHIIGFSIGFMLGIIVEKLPFYFYKAHYTFWTFLWLLGIVCIIYSFTQATIVYWQLVLH